MKLTGLFSVIVYCLIASYAPLPGWSQSNEMKELFGEGPFGKVEHSALRPMAENAKRLVTGEYKASGVLIFRQPPPQRQEVVRPIFNATTHMAGFAEALRAGKAAEWEAAKLKEIRDQQKEREKELERNLIVQKYSVEIESAFDYGAEKFHFRRKHNLIHSSNHQGDFDGEYRISMLRDLISTWNGRYNILRLESPTDPKPNQSPPGLDEYYFNARTMGWGGTSYLTARFDPIALDRFVNREIHELGDTIRQDVYQLENGRTKVESISRLYGTSSDFVQQWILSHEYEMQPVQYCVFERYPEPKTDQQRDENDNPVLLQQATYLWTKVGEVWVLASIEAKSDRNYHGQSQEWQIDFDWHSINEPVDEKRFDYSSWELPRGAQVFDRRKGFFE